MDSPQATVEAASPTPIAASPDEEAEATREKIATDLKNWQDKFAKAADKGTEDLEERVKEITDRQITNQVNGVAEALVIQLEEISKTEIEKLKSKYIFDLVKALPEDHTDDDIERLENKLSQVIKHAGIAIRNKAQALRKWRQDYDEETQNLVSAASESTLEVIDNIRDLGLQEIGMRWAWMEGVTYKDWSKYHSLKGTFEEWRHEVEAVALDHGGLLASKQASEEAESRGMTFAENAAKELARLKDVGKWKIQAADTSDDWNTRVLPPKAAKVGQSVTDKAKSISEEAVGTPQGTMESVVSSISGQASLAAADASSQVIGTEPSMVEHAQSGIVDSVSAASEQVSEAVIDTPRPQAESVASAAYDAADQKVLKASEAIIGTPPPPQESAVSKGSENLDSVTKEAASAAFTASSSASSAAGKASSKAFAGAMAQEVGEQKPIFDDVLDNDDDLTFSEKIQSMVEQAGSKYSDVTKAVSEAMLKPSSTQGTVESITAAAEGRYSQALEAASRALYGTTQGTGESMTSMVSEKYSEAVAA